MNFFRGSHVTNRGRGRNKFYRGRPLPKTTGFFGQGWGTFNNEKIEVASHYKTPTVTESETASSSRYGRQNRVATLLNNTTGRSTSSACPQSSSSSNLQESHVILAITEGRGTSRGEVGIAAVDLRRPHLVVCQLNDNFSYWETLTKIYLINPTEIIVPHTFYDGPKSAFIYKAIQQQFPNVQISPVQRNLFSDIIGTTFIDRICALKYTSVKILLSKKYYALAAAGAVLRYVEILQNILFAPLSVRIEYQGNNYSLLIDFETAIRLELAASLSSKNKKASLFGCINHCITTIGSRTLRANVLQPFTDVNLISRRQDVVQELIEKPNLLQLLKNNLVHFIDVGKLSAFCTLHNTSNSNLHFATDAYLNQILILKTCISFIPSFRDAIVEADADYFAEAREVLFNPSWEIMEQEILKVIHADSLNTKGSGGYAQRCFAVKSNINGLLDIARKTYSEKVDDVRVAVEQLSVKYNLNLRTNYHANKGFHIVMKLNRWDSKTKLPDLPGCFILINRAGCTITMTTQELIGINAVIKEVIREIQIMSNVVISSLLTSIRSYMSILYSLIDLVGELDVLQSLATVSSASNYIRPMFCDHLIVLGGVHPILEYLSDTPLVPNDVKATSLQNFFLITGPNMSGKSTFIKQIAVQHILVQIGCYVPATTAEFRIADRIFSRIYFEDSIETNASSYVLEMREMQYILQQLTPCSIVIIDELCRGTSVEEGTAIAWAISEHLAKIKFSESKNTRNYKIPPKPFIFFTTHYLKLTEMYLHHYNITNLYLEAIEEKSESGRERLKYTHEVKVGSTPVEEYGIQIAKSANLPPSVIQDAEAILKQLKANEQAQTIQTDLEDCIHERLCYEFGATLLTLESASLLTQETLEKVFYKYKENTDLCSKLDMLNEKFANIAVDQQEPLPGETDHDLLNVYQSHDISSSSSLNIVEFDDFENESKREREEPEIKNDELSQISNNGFMDYNENIDLTSERAWRMGSFSPSKSNPFLFDLSPEDNREDFPIHISSQATTVLNQYQNNDNSQNGSFESSFIEENPSKPKPLINIIANETFTEEHPQFKNVQKTIYEVSQPKTASVIPSQKLDEDIRFDENDDLQNKPEPCENVKGKRTAGLPIKSSKTSKDVNQPKCDIPNQKRNVEESYSSGERSPTDSSTTAKDTTSSSGTTTTMWFENMMKTTKLKKETSKQVNISTRPATSGTAVKNATAFVSDPSEFSF